jgi:hypothetical protein
MFDLDTVLVAALVDIKSVLFWLERWFISCKLKRWKSHPLLLTLFLLEVKKSEAEQKHSYFRKMLIEKSNRQ